MGNVFTAPKRLEDLNPDTLAKIAHPIATQNRNIEEMNRQREIEEQREINNQLDRICINNIYDAANQGQFSTKCDLTYHLLVMLEKKGFKVGREYYDEHEMGNRPSDDMWLIEWYRPKQN